MSSGSAAVSLALEALAVVGVETGADVARKPLHALHTTAHLAELVTLVGYLSSVRTRSPGFRGTLAALVGAEVLKRLLAPTRLHRWLDIGSAALGLFGAYHLRSEMIRAGRESANDPRSRS